MSTSTYSGSCNLKHESTYAKVHDPASAKPRPMTNGISQSLGLDLVNINVYAKILSKHYARFQSKGQFILFYFYFNFDLGKASTKTLNSAKLQDIGPVSHFHSLDPDSLIQWQMAFGDPLGYILSLPMCI